MRLAIPLALVLAATTASRQGCGRGASPTAYDACAEKACGAACTACDPKDPSCVETAVVKACDPFGRCVALVAGLCDAAQSACAGMACGDECTIDPPCRSATPPCMVPSMVGHCDPSGTCVPGIPTPNFCPPPVTSCDGQACGVVCEMSCPAGVACDPARGWCAGGQCISAAPPCPPPPPPPPSWGCVGKACGDSCGYCPPGTDPAKCPVPTFAPTACDSQLQCVTEGTFTCPPDPCAGKACGTACDPCGGMCMHPYASACDASAKCVPVPVTCPP